MGVCGVSFPQRLARPIHLGIWEAADVVPSVHQPKSTFNSLVLCRVLEIGFIVQIEVGVSALASAKLRGGGSTSFYLILPHPNFAFFGCPNEVK